MRVWMTGGTAIGCDDGKEVWEVRWNAGCKLVQFPGDR